MSDIDVEAMLEAPYKNEMVNNFIIFVNTSF